MKQVRDLAEVAYAADYARIGRQREAEDGGDERASSVVGIMAGVLPSLRDLNQGYVWDEAGKIVSLVLYARTGLGGSQWSVEAVATHPDHQRRGHARRLMEATVSDLRARGGYACTLKVRDDNVGAYALYRDLGFVHFDTSVHLRGGPTRTASTPNRPASANPRYRVVDAPARAWFSTWQERGDLACRSQSERARSVCPISPTQFRRPWFAPALAPLLTKLSGHSVRHKLVWVEDRLVSTVAVDLALRGPDPHEITITVDPAHEESLSHLLIEQAMALASAAPPVPVLAEVRSTNTCLLEALERRGFARAITWHEMGLRL